MPMESGQFGDVGPGVIPGDGVMPASRPAGILVVLVDRLPAWLLPVYGCGWVSMPALTRLAGAGVVFDRVIATSDDTERMLADYGVGGDALEGRSADALPVAAAARGWGACLVTDADTVPPGWSGAVRRVAVQPRARPAGDAADTALGRLFTVAASVLNEGSAGLVVVQVTSLGRVWDAPAAFREAYVDPEDPPVYAAATVPNFEIEPAADPDRLVAIRQAFAGQLTMLDRGLAELLAAVPGAASAERAGWTVLVAGLRGLPLGLHGHVGPRSLPAFSELVHVPAVLVDAAGRMASQRYDGLVTPADLGAMLAEAAGVTRQAPAETVVPPVDLGGLFTSWRSRGRDRVVVGAAGGGAIVTPDWHAVAAAGDEATPRLWLYAKPDDYFELCDVSERCPTEVERFACLLAAVAAGDLATAWRAES